MNQTEQIYIQLISNGIKDIHKKIDMSCIETDVLVELCKLHKNTGLIYGALMNQENVPQNIMDIFEKGFYAEMMVYSKRTTVFEMVLKELNCHSIKHIIVKGISYAKCYKQSEFRTMGDMDLIISPDDIEKADWVMEELGGILEYERSNDKVHYYKIKNVIIELHTSIGYAGSFHRNYDYERYFKKAVDESVCLKNYTYEFSPFYKIIYAIYHIAKHFYDSGCGVRMITDLAVLMEYYSLQLNMERLWDDLEQMNLKKFAENLFAICYKWFEIEPAGLGHYLQNMEIVESYIISGGVFGHNAVLGDSVQILKQQGTGIKKILKWAFPSYAHMREYSIWFKEKPTVLLPVAYIERFFRNAKERGGILKWMGRLIRANKTKAIQKNIVEIMGLEND